MRRRWGLLALGAAPLWLLLAYVLLPEAWRWRDRGLDARITAAGELLTTTGAGIPGDPVNLLLLGGRADVARAMAAAGWHPADPVTARTSLGIGLSVLLDRADPDAPVSPLLFRGRPQDLAFERADGRSADRRHHVRFWTEGDAAWGAASLDVGVGLSRDTGEVTHHIGPDLDAERDLVVADLRAAGWAGAATLRPGAVRAGRNGGGDPYRTDGDLAVVTLAAP